VIGFIAKGELAAPLPGIEQAHPMGSTEWLGCQKMPHCGKNGSSFFHPATPGRYPRPLGPQCSAGGWLFLFPTTEIDLSELDGNPIEWPRELPPTGLLGCEPLVRISRKDSLVSDSLPGLSHPRSHGIPPTGIMRRLFVGCCRCLVPIDL
jgi:hypothetical protein